LVLGGEWGFGGDIVIRDGNGEFEMGDPVALILEGEEEGEGEGEGAEEGKGESKCRLTWGEEEGRRMIADEWQRRDRDWRRR